MFFFSSRRRHTRCALVTGVQTCALPIYGEVPRLVPTAPLAQKATAGLSAEQNIALQLAVRNIGAFHADSLPPEHWVETLPGPRVGKVWRPSDRGGLYIPGGATPRSEERRVGNGWDRTCREGWPPCHHKKNKT